MNGGISIMEWPIEGTSKLEISEASINFTPTSVTYASGEKRLKGTFFKADDPSPFEAWGTYDPNGRFQWTHREYSTFVPYGGGGTETRDLASTGALTPPKDGNVTVSRKPRSVVAQRTQDANVSTASSAKRVRRTHRIKPDKRDTPAEHPTIIKRTETSVTYPSGEMRVKGTFTRTDDHSTFEDWGTYDPDGKFVWDHHECFKFVPKVVPEGGRPKEIRSGPPAEGATSPEDDDDDNATVFQMPQSSGTDDIQSVEVSTAGGTSASTGISSPIESLIRQRRAQQPDPSSINATLSGLRGGGRR